MARMVCFHCGEHFDQKRLVCPHCGSERDFTHAQEPEEFVVGEAGDAEGWSDSDDAAYQAYLQREGLAPGPPLGTRIAWGIVVATVLTGLILVLL